jgi:phage-related protein
MVRETYALADAEIEALPPGLRARLIRLLETMEKVGLDHLGEPHVKHLDGKLWESRAKAQEGIARGLYVTATGRRLIVLHVFVKKSAKTPRGASDIARKRMKDVIA